MSSNSNLWLSIAALVAVGSIASTAYSQSLPGKAQSQPHGAPSTTANASSSPAPAQTATAGSAAPPTAAAAPAPAPAAPASAAVGASVATSPAPQASPAAAPAPVSVPPGYALVPVENAAQTRYEVEYPQRQGALPPGMELPYDEGEPIPAGYRVVKQPRRGLVIAGSIVGGIAYGFSIMGAVGDDFEHKSGSLLIPVVGPWLMLALGGAKDEKCSYNSTYDVDGICKDNSGLRSMLVLDGLMQVAGATMLFVGIAAPTTRLVRRDVTLSMVPMTLGKDGYGLGAVGRF